MGRGGKGNNKEAKKTAVAGTEYLEKGMRIGEKTAINSEAPDFATWHVT